MGKDEEEQSSRGFKVEDRRRFVDDAAPPAEEKPAAAPSAPAAAPVQHDHAGHDHDHEHQEHEHHGHEHEHHDHEHHDHDHEHHDHEHHGEAQEINFTTFVMGLTTQALMHLGEIAEPGQPQVPDLPAAKQMIDLLGVLRDKTKGNLDAAEEQLLASMLYDLRMRYVEVSRHR
jgi:ABC-type Zn2+ transport system substrate-binding protein/surface adhesin